MTKLFRGFLFALLGASVAAMVWAFAGETHPMPLAACHVPNVRWNVLSTLQQERYVRCNRNHAISAIQFVRAHAAKYPAGVADRLIREHRAIRSRATRNLHAIQDRVYLTGGFADRFRIVTEVVCSFDWQGTPCSGSYSVMRVTLCETAGTLLAEPGDDPDSQYRGLFELGTWERQHYGVGRYASGTYSDVYAGAWDQVTSAHNLFVGEGRGWSPWACRPDGSVAY